MKVLSRDDPKTRLVLYLAGGLGLNCLLIVVFKTEIRELFALSPLLSFDQWAGAKILALRSPPLTVLMEGVTLLGGGAVMTAAGMAICVILCRGGRFLAMTGFSGALAGGGLLVAFIKGQVQRIRPLDPLSAAAAGGWSFPSAHTMMAFIFWGMLAYFWVRMGEGQSRARRFGFLFAAVMVPGSVGLSRIYLLVHYPSDVVAGYVWGLCWLAVCVAGLEVVDVRSEGIPVKEEGT